MLQGLASIIIFYDDHVIDLSSFHMHTIKL